MVLVNEGVVTYSYNGGTHRAIAQFNFWKDGIFMQNKCFACVKSTAVAVTGNNVVITIPEGNYYDCELVKLCICQSIPATATPAMTFVIKLGAAATLYPINTKCGHLVYGDQMRSRKAYILRVATDTQRFSYVDGAPLCCTAHVNPPVLTAPPAEEN